MAIDRPMCEATKQLARIRYEFRIQRGQGVTNLGKLEGMTTLGPCDHEGGHRAAQHACREHLAPTSRRGAH